MAVILYLAIPATTSRRKVSVFDLREPYIDKLRYAIGTYDWHGVFCDVNDIDIVYSNFLNVIHSLIAACVPTKSVAVSPRDPDFVTPLVKVLLNKRTRLRRRGKIEAANKIACKINDIIVSIRSKRLTNVARGSVKELWAQVRSKAKARNKPILIGGNDANPDQLNQYSTLQIFPLTLIIIYQLSLSFTLRKMTYPPP